MFERATNLRVFLSWSGDSRPVAALLREWLRQVLHPLDPWMSDEDIAKGTRGLQAMDEALEQADYGIICVTHANQESPWLAYEAGALAKNISRSRVSPLVLDITPTELQGPLAHLQATQPTREDVGRLVRSLNAALGDENRLKDEVVERSIDKWWDELEKGLRVIAASHDHGVRGVARPAPIDTVLAAVIQAQQSIDNLGQDLRRLADSPISAPRTPAVDGQAGARDAPDDLRFRSTLGRFEDRLQNARVLWLLGQSLDYLMTDQYDALQRFAIAGGEIRAMVLDPSDDELLMVASRGLYGVQSTEDLRADIRGAIESIGRLVADASGNTFDVQLRTLRTLPAFSAVLTEREVSVEVYPYKTSAARRPNLVVEASDEWYGYFRDQLHALWESGTTPDES